MTHTRDSAGGQPTPGAIIDMTRARQAAGLAQAIRATRRATTTARSVAYPPIGPRAQWLHVVGRCPFCRGGHVHRAGPEGGRRRAGCGLGSYVVEPWIGREDGPA
jgi:hypothetical protein